MAEDTKGGKGLRPCGWRLESRSGADLGTSIDLKSYDKELKAVMPEKSKTCVTAFIKRLVTNFQLSRTRKGHFFLK